MLLGDEWGLVWEHHGCVDIALWKSSLLDYLIALSQESGLLLIIAALWLLRCGNGFAKFLASWHSLRILLAAVVTFSRCGTPAIPRVLLLFVHLLVHCLWMKVQREVIVMIIYGCWRSHKVVRILALVQTWIVSCMLLLLFLRQSGRSCACSVRESRIYESFCERLTLIDHGLLESWHYILS